MSTNNGILTKIIERMRIKSITNYWIVRSSERLISSLGTSQSLRARLSCGATTHGRNVSGSSFFWWMRINMLWMIKQMFVLFLIPRANLCIISNRSEGKYGFFVRDVHRLCVVGNVATKDFISMTPAFARIATKRCVTNVRVPEIYGRTNTHYVRGASGSLTTDEVFIPIQIE